MSKARAIIEDKQPSEGMKWYNWALSSSQQFTGYATIGAQFAWQYGRIIGWWIVTTGMITAVPLLFEVKRESMIEDLERIQIGKSLAEGRTPQDLAMEGLTAAIDPKVLK